nr:SMP-30/gluconolactonase/LRE family protein [Kribbella catacumbae]
MRRSQRYSRRSCCLGLLLRRASPRVRGATFYAGDLFTGDIFRGDVEKRSAAPFIDAPAGRQAVGMAVNTRNDLLFVAGGFTGQAYVYDTDSGATVASYQLGDPGTSLINDVALTPQGAWFTDSLHARLHFVPIDQYGNLGPFRTLKLSGPAADTGDEFNLNGIAATEDGQTLIVAHSGNGELYTVNPAKGTSAHITGVSVPTVDGIVLDDSRLWAVQSFSNQITRIALTDDLSSGVVKKTITNPLFQVPATAALFGDTLAAVNAKFDTGVPPTADQYEIVLVDA